VWAFCVSEWYEVWSASDRMELSSQMISHFGMERNFCVSKAISIIRAFSCEIPMFQRLSLPPLSWTAEKVSETPEFHSILTRLIDREDLILNYELLSLERILTMVYVVQSYWACFGLYPSSCMWKTKNPTTFRRLELSPSSVIETSSF
jgi:hypothetical protein